MKKSYALLAITALVIVAYSCKKNESAKLATTGYLDLPAKPYEYFGSMGGFDTTANHKATLGRVLFYDSRLSLNNAISCGSCHKQAYGFADNVALSVGFEGRLTKRNSKGIVNLAGDNPTFFTIGQPVSPLFWDGRETVLKNLVARPITNHVEMGISDQDGLCAKLSQLSYYGPLFQKAYGDEVVTMDRIGECVATFMSSISSHETRFDQFQMGNMGALSATEERGFTLFTTTYNCESCHHVFQNFYSLNFDMHDIGLDAVYTDKGMGAITTSANDGKFRVPSLRNVALTAPYMHDGRFKTLDEVMEHYSHNIQDSPNLDTVLAKNGRAMRMNIPAEDKKALIAFLGTLTDYSMVTDDKFSNPFKAK